MRCADAVVAVKEASAEATVTAEAAEEEEKAVQEEV